MTLEIGIVGCGIGGLAVATLLARQGHRVSIFDQFEAPQPIGSGLVIQPVGQAVLADLGVLEAVMVRGAPIHRMQGHDARSGRQVLLADYGPTGGARFGLAIHRAALFETLLSATLSEGVSFHHGWRVTGITNPPQRALEREDGASAGPFDLVIDASGAGSPLAPSTGTPLSYGALWGTVTLPPGLSPGDELRQRYRGAHTMLGILPLGRPFGGDDDQASIFFSLPQSRYPAWQAEDLAQWKAEAAALWPIFGTLLNEIEDHAALTMAKYRHGTLPNPVAAGLVHIGDAAHQASPQLGQGANMALLDAAALAAALKDCASLADGLADYAKSRRRHVRVYQTLSRIFTPMYQSDSRVLPWVRDWVLMPVSQVPPVPAILRRIVSGDLVAPIRL